MPKATRMNTSKQHTVSLEDTEELGSGDVLDLSDTVRISQDHTNLGGSKTLFCFEYK